MAEVEAMTIAIYFAVYIFGFVSASAYFLKKENDELKKKAKA